ncbi:polyprenyl synthetase family protein [Candidatus Amesbacteria bacterium]|nr:polyprenyl synthetase family protein [Candidatus Amesbacteria bacterium]
MIERDTENNRPIDNREWAQNELGQFKSRFDPILAKFLNKETVEAEAINPRLGRLLRVCSDFILEGGKRLRPAFVYFGYKAVGGDEDAAIMQAAISFELVHAGALVHDDVMDNSDKRRNKPTVHRIFEEDWGSAEVGRSLAIAAGDTILALSDKAMTNYPIFDQRFKRARQYFDQMCTEINYGQHLDVVGNLMPAISIDWIMAVMRYKTAGYTVEKPLLVGATLGGADINVIEALSKYGVNLGVAFQIQDDILGMFGDEKKVGKPVDSDLKEGKKTLLVSKTLEVLLNNGRNEELDRFRFILGNSSLSQEDYIWCQKLIKETGALKYCRGMVDELTGQATTAVADAHIDGDAKKYLLGIAESLVAREY